MSSSIVSALDARLSQILSNSLQHSLFETLRSASIGDCQLPTLVREILFRVSLYGPSLYRASLHGISRVSVVEDRVAERLRMLIVEESSHPKLAYDDYRNLGGTGECDLVVSPAAFVIARIAEAISTQDDPYAFLGYFYLMEATTPAFLQAAAPHLRRKFPAGLTPFATLHLEVDEGHAGELREILEQLDGRHDTAIRFAFECFARVYPSLIWDEVAGQIGR